MGVLTALAILAGLIERQRRGVQFALRAIHLGGASRPSPGFVFLVGLSLVLIIKDTSQLA
jgi:hypothetical protein